MKSRYKILFENLSSKKERGFIPFIVLGDPSISVSLKIIDILINNGADALELGIPFSDPIADGIIIQNSHQRALKQKITVQKCFDMIRKIRKKHSHIPIGLLTYTNLIFFKKLPIFYSLSRSSGIDSILIADLPIEESDPFQNFANKHNISSIFICPPDANKDFIKKITQMSTSYIYLVSRSGITGEQEIYLKNSLSVIIRKLKKYKSSPIIQGFGISNTKQIKKALSNDIDGIICGSCIVKIIENNLSDIPKMFKEIKIIIQNLKNATKNI